MLKALCTLLTESAKEILEKIKTDTGDQEYIFSKDGARVMVMAINKALEVYAKDKGLPVKESHTIRRTYASDLYSYGFSLEKIRVLLGHASIQTTIKYLFDTGYDEDVINDLNAALKSG